MGYKGGKSPEGTARFHEVLVLQRKDSHETIIQHNKDMILDESDPLSDSASQIDWDGDIWPQHRVLAAFIFNPRLGQYGIALKPVEGAEEPRTMMIYDK